VEDVIDSVLDIGLINLQEQKSGIQMKTRARKGKLEDSEELSEPACKISRLLST